MVSHVIIWKLKPEAGDPEEIKKNAKENLEALNGRIDGLINIEIFTEALPSSSGDMMLVSSFESEAALEGYRTNPLHVKAADTYVRPFYDIRLSFDTKAEDSNA